ncbi:unnamed protein product [Anisakis simplex]|uniref:Big bang (inferred by orthology to a D. melanogaster protein) n=1 Tax=Anisakis simplex TaxID=6269 RepID=A0A0M3JVV7_ANISI|nr:unnamed protein product [Anisakis simplex]
MALRLDTMNVSNAMIHPQQNRQASNDVFDVALSSHSPLSNDSGFNSDRIAVGEAYSRRQCQQPQPPTTAPPPLRTKNISHKLTYDSVYATDPDTNTRFDKFDKSFQTNRPNCLANPLRFPRVSEENRPKSPVPAPLIMPSLRNSNSKTPNSPFFSPPVDKEKDIYSDQFSYRYPNNEQPYPNSEKIGYSLPSSFKPLSTPPASLAAQQPPTPPSEPPPSDPIVSKSIETSTIQTNSTPTAQKQNSFSDSVFSSKYFSSQQMSSARNEVTPIVNSSDTITPKPSESISGEIVQQKLSYNKAELPPLRYTRSSSNMDIQPPQTTLSPSKHQLYRESQKNENSDFAQKLFESKNAAELLQQGSLRISSPGRYFSEKLNEETDSEHLLLSRDDEMPFYKSNLKQASLSSTVPYAQSPSPVLHHTLSSQKSNDKDSVNKYSMSTSQQGKPTTITSSVKSSFSSSPSAFTNEQNNPSLASPSSVSASSFSINRRAVPVNKLIEKFSQNDTGAPVMPALYGASTKNVNATPTLSPTRTTNLVSHEDPLFAKSKPQTHEITSAETTKMESNKQRLYPSLSSDSTGYASELTTLPKATRTTSIEKSTSNANSPTIRHSDEQLKTEHASQFNWTTSKNTAINPSRYADERRESISKENFMEHPHEIINLSSSVLSQSQAELNILPKKVFRCKQSLKILHPPPLTDRCEASLDKHGAFVGLDFSRYDVAEEDVIGRPIEAEEAEEVAIRLAKEFPLKSQICWKDEPTTEQMAECKEAIGSESFADYDIFTVNLKSFVYITISRLELYHIRIEPFFVSFSPYFMRDLWGIQVQKVITGSLADQSDNINRGDRVFFIQNRSTRKMSTSDARSLIKSPSPVVSFVLGRRHTSNVFNFTSAPLEMYSTVSCDPDRFQYSLTPEDVVLTKGNLGVGLSLDGGKGSIYGDRPIIVKRIFEGGSAAKSGRVKVGDQIAAIDDMPTTGMSYLEATKTLRSRPEGPVKITIYSRI